MPTPASASSPAPPPRHPSSIQSATRTCVLCPDARHYAREWTFLFPVTLRSSPHPREGHGRVIATKHIKQFNKILTSFPAIVADNELFPPKDDEEDGPPEEGPWLFTRALEQLGDRERFLKLARSRDDEKVHAVEDMIRTNLFGVYTEIGRDIKGLYPEMARLNHDCDPNAYGQYTKGDLAMTAVATRDIEPGEEITISYPLPARPSPNTSASKSPHPFSDIPLGMPTFYRRKALSNWSFNCTCALYTSGINFKSDTRRNRLVELFYSKKKLVPSSSNPPPTEEEIQANYEQLVEHTKEFVDIFQQERLFPKVGEYYQEFMKIYYGFGDVQGAERYARTALRYAEAFADPAGGFCWGLRRDLALLSRWLGSWRSTRGGWNSEFGDLFGAVICLM